MNHNKNKVKICFCMYQIITGGIEKCLLRIIENLSNQYDISVVVKRPIYEQYFIDFFNSKNIKVINFDNASNKRKAYKLFNNVDVIVDYFSGSFLSELQNVWTPKICFYHSSINFFDRQFLNVKDLLFNTYDKFVCLTNTFKKDIIKRCPEYKDKIVQMYNPINLDELRNLSNTNNYPNDCSKYFVFLGRFHEDKDHDCVIKAFNQFAKNTPDAKMFFLGAGEKEREYKEKVQNLGLQDKIIFTGAISNPYGYLKHCAANILSSANEGLSNVLIEGATLGVLNISSDCDAAVEVLMNGKAGILFPIGDSETLAKIMYDVWNGKVDKSKYIEEGYKNLYRFDITNIILQFKDLITNVINTAPNYRKQKIKNFLQRIFSIKNSYNKSHKIITILGIKIKIKRGETNA